MEYNEDNGKSPLKRSKRLKGVIDMANNMGEDLKRVLMAGIGAAALTAEKSKELIEKLVDKGELTAAQAKELIEKMVEKGEMTAEQGKQLAAKLADKAEQAAKKGKNLFDKLVEKGEESVRQGRERNEELKRNAEVKKKEKILADVLASLDQLDPQAREAVKNKLAEEKTAEASPEEEPQA
jgi:polyhydroxyalkanoate synthesis regulator phasin